jgi:hypothetical protein
MIISKKEALTKYGLITYFSLFPILLFNTFWGWVFNAGKVAAWDGTGHYGIVQLYEKNIFPDVFGWNYNFFEGMAFPNYYPPFFYWLVALLSKFVDFDLAFKIVLILPLLIIPGLIWYVAWNVSEKNIFSASLSIVGLLVLLIDPRSNGSENFPSGLDYHSTYVIGLYSQPLGFIFILFWYNLFRNADKSKTRFILATVCQSLAVLSNVFSVFLVGLIALSILTTDLFEYFKEKDLIEKKLHSKRFLCHVHSILISVGLTAFWIVPLLTTYKYVVTLPFQTLPMTDFLVIWYLVATIGSVYWLTQGKREAFYYTGFCLLLAFLIFVIPFASITWIPFQTHRVWSSFNFLLAVPFGIGMVFIFKCIFQYPFTKFEKIKNLLQKTAPFALTIWLIFFAAVGYLYTTIPIARLYARFIAAASFYSYISPAEPLPKPRIQNLKERDLGGLSEDGV